MSIQVANVTTTTASVYTSSGNTAITFLSLCNYGASNVSANVFVVPNGGVVGNATAVLKTLGITTLDTYQLYSGGEKLLLSDGDSIQVNCSANNAITVTTSYTTI
jgi:hypothetical protein